jgi:hypothetical protein
MCTEYDYDEAILSIRPHAPNAAHTIERYVRQLKRLNTDNIETMRMAGINAVGMIEIEHRAGMTAYDSINEKARVVIEGSK